MVGTPIVCPWFRWRAPVSVRREGPGLPLLCHQLQLGPIALLGFTPSL
jgi:hypothetical protein